MVVDSGVNFFIDICEDNTAWKEQGPNTGL